jgi:hypothetical protein
VPRIGHTEQAVVLRTDFSDEACWRSICAEVLAETADGFRAYVDVVEDRAFDGFGTDDVLATVGDDYRWGYLVVGDRVTMTQAEHPFLVLDLLDERGRSFRALPREIQAIENNLSIANMDFSEFADSAGSDGVFRGFE